MYGYTGHVVNLPQDVASFAQSLPRLPSDLDVIVVRREGANQTHRDFRVRRSIVHRALQWLVIHNQYYRSLCITIDTTALEQLPQDGNVSDLVLVTQETSSHTSTSTVDSTSSDITHDSLYDDHLQQSFIPIAVPSMTEQETLQQSVDQRQSSSSSHTPLMWPSIGGIPLNEFTTEGYFTCAFPTLFPTVAADFLGQRQVPATIGNYFKHLMQYDDGRFAKHPRFRFFALNTKMQHRALQTGRVYIRQHPGDGQLSLDELRDMVGRQGEAFSSRVLHYASSLHGTKQYWQRQRSRLLSMVDTLGLPTVFFTHSAADLQWPELARLICPDNPDSRTARANPTIENPALADWFFYHRVLGATDYWLRFEWQHRGSPHVHGLAWLPDTPDVEKLCDGASEALHTEIIRHADQLVSTTNPALLPDGSNIADAPAPKVDPHICNKAYGDIQDFDQDLSDLVATCQRHTRCSASYCLGTKHGKQQCRFGYPKPLRPHRAIITEDEPTLLTARNDGLINSFNPVQLSAWHANVDSCHGSL